MLHFCLLDNYQPLISPMVVLGTLKAASDVLEKRGNIYSSRPRNIMGSVAILISHPAKSLTFWFIGENFSLVECEELVCHMVQDGGIGEL